MTDRPSMTKSSLAVAVAAAAGWWLYQLPIGSGTPTALDLRTITRWWMSIDTPIAVMTIVRSVGVGTALYMSMIGIVGIAAGAAGNVRAFTALWRTISTKSIRRAVAVGAITAWSISPALVSAGGDLPHPIVLVDLGPASVPGRSADPEPAGPIAETAPETDIGLQGSWTVAPGDHLWGIAHRVLRADGPEPTQRAINAYWRKLIANNADVVGGNPDLIYPGQVLALPQR